MDDTCPIRTKCFKPTQLEFLEIEHFLNNSKKIKMNIVYYNSLLKEVFKNYLFKKNISANCDILYTKLDNYYYIYNGIMSNLEVFWESKNTKAKLGNHITIGYDNRGWNIHETSYSTGSKLIYSKNKFTDFYYIIKKEKSIHYIINQLDQTLIPVPANCKIKSKMNINSIWNEILYGTIPPHTPLQKNNQGDKKIAIKKPIKKKEITNFSVIDSIKKIKLKEDELAIYRININKKLIFQNKVIRASNDKNVLFIHDLNFTYILINIKYEPQDLDEY